MHRHLLYAGVLIAAILFVAAGCVGGGPATRRPAKLKPGDRAERLPADHSRILGIDIRQDNISDVEAAFGSAVFLYRGDFDLGNCYVSRDGNFLEFFVSSTSIGYAVSKVLGHEVRAENCKLIDVSDSDLVNGAGLRIGLSRQEIHALLGSASRQTADAKEYRYIFWVQEQADVATSNRIRQADQLPPDHEIWLNLYSVIKVLFENDIVVGFEIDKSDAFR